MVEALLAGPATGNSLNGTTGSAGAAGMAGGTGARKGAGVNVAMKNGVTALHWAARNGHPDVVRVLLAAKADVNASAKDRVRPLVWAAQFGHDAVVDVLIRAGAVGLDAALLQASEPDVQQLLLRQGTVFFDHFLQRSHVQLGAVYPPEAPELTEV